MRRLFIGICSIVLVTTGAAVLGGGAETSHSQVTAAGCIRAGLLMGAIWLAWPQTSDLIERVPRWVAVTMLGCLLVLVVRPKLIVFVAPLLLALLVLHWMGLLLRPKKTKSQR